jgi:oligopeptide transport system substrate-binding protein
MTVSRTRTTVSRTRTKRQILATGISRRDFLKMGGAGLAGATLLGPAGCGVFQGEGSQQGGGGGGSKSITLNLGDTIRDLNSVTTTDSVSGADILLNVMEGLYRLDADLKPEPAQAESVNVSGDKLTYTFTLRDGIKWSDGSPVTSQDFKYAWLRAMHPDTAGQYAYILTTFIKGGAEFNAGDGSAENVAVETPDDKTLEVTLASPSPFWLGLTAFQTYSPQKQSFVEEQGDKYAQSADALLYNGPYTLTDFRPTQGVSFVKNDQYWDKGNVAIEQIDAKIVKERDTAVNLHEAGQLDITEISGEFVDEFRDSPDFHSQTNFAVFYLVGNYELPFFQNRNIRRAFQLGFDRKAMTREILNDGSEPALGYVPSGIAGPGDQTFREAVGPTMPDFDAQEARRLFEKGTQELGENPTIELLAYDTESGRDIATFLQSQFEENLGAKIDVKVQPFDRKLELESDGEFQLSWQGWIADYNDPMTFMDLWLSDSSFNTQKYDNARYDELVGGAQTETDFAKRMDMLLEAEKVLVGEDAACAPMFYEGQVRLVTPSIKNFVYYRSGGYAMKLWKV